MKTATLSLPAIPDQSHNWRNLPYQQRMLVLARWAAYNLRRLS